MTDIEKNNSVELSEEELKMAAGGASRYKPLTERPGFIIYKVVRGDTLIRIAKAHKCTENDLLLWNPKITNRNEIYAGEYIYIKA